MRPCYCGLTAGAACSLWWCVNQEYSEGGATFAVNSPVGLFKFTVTALAGPELFRAGKGFLEDDRVASGPLLT